MDSTGKWVGIGVLAVVLGFAIWWMLPNSEAPPNHSPESDAIGSADESERERARLQPGQGLRPISASAVRDVPQHPPPTPGQTGAAKALEDAELAFDVRCESLDDRIQDVDALSEFMPARHMPSGRIGLLRQFAAGHQVIPTADGAVELRWSKEDCTIQAARNGTVTGRVVSRSGDPVEGATVTVCSQTTQSSRDGSFELHAVVDGSSPLSEEAALCVVRASHPDRGNSVAQSHNIEDDPQIRLTLSEEPTSSQAYEQQVQATQAQLNAVMDGEIDPAFEEAAERAEALERLSQDPSLDTPTRRALYEASQRLMDNVGDNEALIERLERGPGR